VKIAVIGAGRMGQIHATLLAGSSVVGALIVADTNDEQAKILARRLGAEHAPDPVSALESADAAVIATPAESHAELVRIAVTRGAAVLCEKPFTESLEAAIDLADRVEASGVPVMVGFHRRFDDGYRAAHEAVSDGRLGRLHLLRLQATEPGAAPSPKTNLLRNTAIHDFDLVRWLSGQEVLSVYVDGGDRELDAFDPRLDPDTIVASLRMTGGAIAAVTVTRLSPLGYDVRAELVGSRDHLAVGWSDRSPVHSVGRTTSGDTNEHWGSWQTRFKDAYRHEVEAFLIAISAGVPSGAAVRDAVEAHRIADAARRSLVRGVPVRLLT
jgi:myo-inositol 2-dehydrogenase/D-chiro-inositol 1-dehydrogenase